MEKLLDVVAAEVCLVSQEKAQAIASRIRRTDGDKAATALSRVVGTPAAAGVVEQLIDAWRAATAAIGKMNWNETWKHELVILALAESKWMIVVCGSAWSRGSRLLAS